MRQQKRHQQLMERSDNLHDRFDKTLDQRSGNREHRDWFLVRWPSHIGMPRGHLREECDLNADDMGRLLARAQREVEACKAEFNTRLRF